jgi:hypothetical protein
MKKIITILVLVGIAANVMSPTIAKAQVASSQIKASDLENVAANYRTLIQRLNPVNWAGQFANDGQFQDFALMPSPVSGFQNLVGFFHSLSDVLESIPQMDFSNQITYDGMIKFEWTYQVKAKNGKEALWSGTTILVVDTQLKVSKVLVFWDAKKGLKDIGISIP